MEVCLHLKLIILFNIASYAVYHPHTPESVSQVTVQLPSDFLKAVILDKLHICICLLDYNLQQFSS